MKEVEICLCSAFPHIGFSKLIVLYSIFEFGKISIYLKSAAIYFLQELLEFIVGFFFCVVLLSRSLKMPPKKESTVTKDTAKCSKHGITLCKVSKKYWLNVEFVLQEVSKASDVYELHAKVLCQHLDNLYYEAKIINVEHGVDGEPIYTVHYQGWNQRHDEKIKHSSTRSRFLEYTTANVERAKVSSNVPIKYYVHNQTLLLLDITFQILSRTSEVNGSMWKAEMRDAQARLAQNKRRSRKSNVLDEKRSGGADSRGSTPSDKRGTSTSRAASIVSDKGTVRKRKPGTQLESEPVSDFIRKNEIKIDIPSVLKDILVDDHDMVNRQMYLPRLPARHTVAAIVRQYADYMGTCVEAKDTLTFEFGSDDTQLNSMVVTLVESSYGIQDYFNSSLGLQLLYKFERPQYADLLAQHKTKQEGTKDAKKKRSNDAGDGNDSPTDDYDKFKPSEYYGFIHLLRLFVRFGHMLGLTNWSERTIEAIVNQVHNFLKFLEVNRHKFFDIETDYEVAPPEYQRRVWSS
ncbi:unnamed protein product [Wuchereria bancrofti]|uniref:Uncharacterized protein n=2 Tax=Wuchereria bancrofti TaxID=6293 RepID=A0A3P7DC56_WUCBA|nr:unnamed protein product [Wuchereria bancrofti]